MMSSVYYFFTDDEYKDDFEDDRSVSLTFNILAFCHSVGPATTTFGSYAAFVPTLTSKQPTPSSQLLYIQNLTIVTVCTLTCQRLR